MLHKKNGQRRYKYLVLGRDKSYFLKTNNLILPKGSLKLVPLFQAQCDQQNHQTYNYLAEENHLYSGT
jgi:hypothetical protein